MPLRRIIVFLNDILLQKWTKKHETKITNNTYERWLKKNIRK